MQLLLLLLSILLLSLYYYHHHSRVGLDVLAGPEAAGKGRVGTIP